VQDAWLRWAQATDVRDPSPFLTTVVTRLCGPHRGRHTHSHRPRRRLALEYAEAMSSTPIAVTDEMVEALRRHLSDKQVVELTAYIALENTRARQNAALGIGSQGYSTGACAVPQTHAQQARQPV
jgi:alkylhydroperoxidase family enzyme